MRGLEDEGAMKPAGAVLAAALLAAGVAVGVAAGLAIARLSAPDPTSEQEATLASFRLALEDRDWLTRSHRMSAYLQRLGPDELPEALEALERRRAWLGAEELRLFMLAWSRFDAPAAFESALAWPGRSQRTAAGAAIYAWAFTDPDAALRALEAVEDTQLRDFLRTRLVAGWVRSEQKDGANRYIASLPEGAQRDSFVGMLARELNEQGSEAVMRWAESVPEILPSYKQVAFHRACAAIAASDPEAAVRWLGEHSGRDYAKGSFAIIAGRWADIDPQAALEWLMGLPPDPARDRAIADAFVQWLDFARVPAEGWLRAATPSEALDEAVRVMVRRTNQNGSSEGAMAWALRIEEPELRDEVIVAFGRSWLRREPAAARKWLGEGTLPEGVISAILEPKEVAQVGEDSAEEKR
jgi:hypothetical protein